MDFPYTYDQVVEAIASTRGDGAHFILTRYLSRHKEDVGAERFRRLLATANLRGQDQMNVHIKIAQLDPTYTAELPGVLRSASSIGAQQVLLMGLPDLLPREGQNSALADGLEAWLRRRVKRPSFLKNSAMWEIPSVVLAVSYSTNTARARALLADLEPYLDERERPLAQAANDSDDEGFDVILEKWRTMDSDNSHSSPSEIADEDREAAKYMRRLGVPTSA